MNSTPCLDEKCRNIITGVVRELEECGATEIIIMARGCPRTPNRTIQATSYTSLAELSLLASMMGKMVMDEIDRRGAISREPIISVIADDDGDYRN